MTPGQMEARKKKMARAMGTPPNYLTANALADKKKWKKIKDDGLPRY
ncbi:MAG: hypothetical protein ACE5R5_05920 [Nitrosarchaeum sp.]|jgi:hypothetical protein